jgi:hypothetical protein
MASKTGRMRVGKTKVYFDETGWALVKGAARLQKKSPTYVVTRSLMLYLEKRDGKKAKNLRNQA